MTTTISEIVPFGLRHTTAPHHTDVDPAPRWDADRQVNLGPDGGLWARTVPMAKTVTSTNQDGKSDDTTDPYC